jgi:calcyclin binding protein
MDNGISASRRQHSMASSPYHISFYGNNATMAGGETLHDEILELEALVAQVKTAGNKRDLEQLLRTKQTQWKQQSPPEQQDEPMHEAREDATLELPKPAPVKVGAHAAKPADIGEDINVYTEISRFGWEDEGYGKDKVTVHIMSGVDGVGELPKDNVTCTFTKDSFDLKILGLHGKNYRYVST